jgi:hypothetical protein
MQAIAPAGPATMAVIGEWRGGLTSPPAGWVLLPPIVNLRTTGKGRDVRSIHTALTTAPAAGTARTRDMQCDVPVRLAHAAPQDLPDGLLEG